MPGLAIADLLQELSFAPIAVQRQLDAQYEQDLLAAVTAAAPLAEIAGGVAIRAFEPVPLRAAKTQVRCSVQVRRDRSTRFALTVAPIGVGFTVLHQTETSSSSQITLAVEQIPLRAIAEEAHHGQ